ncbi:MAG TPA: Gfo/Idh/MocA family oxidoreductase [Pirellulales bacterium]
MQRRELLAGAVGLAALGSSLGRASLAAAEPRPKIKVAQIGVRHSHAAGKLEAIRRLSDDYEVVAIAERDAKAREAAAKSEPYLGLNWATEDDVLARDDVQAVVVETHWNDATAVALRAIEAGKHIHLDKPGGVDHAAFRAMRQRAEERGLIVQMGYMLRYNPAFELLFQAQREGWFGEILEVDASMGKLAPPGSRRELNDYPGHGMFELACHVVDAVVTLLGKPEKVSSFAKRSRAPQDDFPDVQLAVLEYPKALATIRCNHADPNGGPRRKFEVAGSAGRFEISPLESGRGTLSLSKKCGDYAAGTHTIQLPVPKGRYDGEFIDLARCIRGESTFRWNAAHDVALHATAQRAAGLAVAE